ncbi:MAG: hypothetical protein Q4E38_00915 [Eubacteriales bacterium]|nr:hypothetical protein [Eubacteriales bacterium]
MNACLYRIDGAEICVERDFRGERPAAALLYELLEERPQGRCRGALRAEEAD